MTYRTHREFSIWFALLLNILVYELKLSNTNYYINLVVMLLFSKQGALFPDVDHSWQNVKEKTMVNRAINFLIHLTGGKHRSWQTHSLDIWLGSFIGLLVLVNKLGFEDRAVALLVLLGFYGGWFSHLFSDALTLDGIRIFCFSSKLKIRLVPKQANLTVNLMITLILFVSSVMWYIVNLPSRELVASIGLLLAVVFGIFSLKIGNMRFRTGFSSYGEKDSSGNRYKPTWEDIVYALTLRVNLVIFIVALVYPYAKVLIK